MLFETVTSTALCTAFCQDMGFNVTQKVFLLYVLYFIHNLYNAKKRKEEKNIYNKDHSLRKVKWSKYWEQISLLVFSLIYSYLVIALRGK